MKNSTKYKLIVPALVAMSLPLCSLAEWNVLADFEDQNLDDWFFSNRISIQPQNTDEHDGWNMVMERPYDDQGGFVMAVSEGTSWYNIYEAAIDLGVMSETDDYTIYFEMAYNDDSSDIVVAVGDMKIPLVVGEGEDHGWTVEEPAWGDFSILSRFGVNGLDVRDLNGTGYAEDYGSQELQVWYQVWFVVHPQFYSWSMWIQGGAFTEQTQVADFHYFRKNDTDGVGPLRTLDFRVGGNSSSATTTGAPKYIDNVAVDTSGQNLTVPEAGGTSGPGTWAGWDIADASGNVNTDPWLGWLNVANDPYVWSSSLESYLYIDESWVTDSGSWIYIHK